MTVQIFNGSCLCGSVTYELKGDAKRFYHCHCQRCRKATGTGHASNIMVKEESFNWLTGQSLLKRYKVPEAERFYTHFCSECGSPMPRDVPEIGMVIIPAGCVDNLINLKPEARIFWNSRADWSCDGDEIPTFAEYPD
ncbi:hypothetical protein MNBD_GAMMA21-657 [hydrothermal vent metagenome]|uniref:CENP-V/GFA domain-containing protein n=1 Tax=hydrothermal vent metagenome TaxID=652676 RepID=A0A3B1B5I1_9ZZZZ